MTNKIYVLHERINGGKELLLNDAPDVIDLRIHPSPDALFIAEEVELQAFGMGLLSIFRDAVPITPRDDLVRVRIGGRYRPAYVKERPLSFQRTARQRVVLRLSGPPEDLSLG